MRKKSQLGVLFRKYLNPQDVKHAYSLIERIKHSVDDRKDEILELSSMFCAGEDGIPPEDLGRHIEKIFFALLQELEVEDGYDYSRWDSIYEEADLRKFEGLVDKLLDRFCFVPKEYGKSNQVIIEMLAGDGKESYLSVSKKWVMSDCVSMSGGDPELGKKLYATWEKKAKRLKGVKPFPHRKDQFVDGWLNAENRYRKRMKGGIYYEQMV